MSANVPARWLQRSYWWIIRRFYPVTRVGTLELFDLRSRQQPATVELASILRDAHSRIESTGEAYAKLVTDNLKVVGALGKTGANVWVGVRAYVSSFDKAEQNPHYLASRLVWAAEYLRTVTVPSRSSDLTARDSAKRAQLAFLARFPDSDRWVDYVQRHS